MAAPLSIPGVGEGEGDKPVSCAEATAKITTKNIEIFKQTECAMIGIWRSREISTTESLFFQEEMMTDLRWNPSYGTVDLASHVTCIMRDAIAGVGEGEGDKPVSCAAATANITTKNIEIFKQIDCAMIGIWRSREISTTESLFFQEEMMTEWGSCF
nr:hypothetical protein Iba_chr04cCG10630 [Ipomoea batatas]